MNPVCVIGLLSIVKGLSARVHVCVFSTPLKETMITWQKSSAEMRRQKEQITALTFLCNWMRL